MRARKILAAFVLAAWTVPLPAFSQLSLNCFSRISPSEDLAEKVIRFVFQDSSGFLWFGTRTGLNRYDGYSFKLYEHDLEDSASLSNNDVTRIYEDTAGVIWVGTLGGGLNRFDDDSEAFTRYRHDPARHDTLTHDIIHDIAEDSDGRLWIATKEGLDRRRDDGSFVHYKHVESDPASLSHNSVNWIVYL